MKERLVHDALESLDDCRNPPVDEMRTFNMTVEAIIPPLRSSYSEHVETDATAKRMVPEEWYLECASEVASQYLKPRSRAFHIAILDGEDDDVRLTGVGELARSGSLDAAIETAAIEAVTAEAVRRMNRRGLADGPAIAGPGEAEAAVMGDGDGGDGGES